MSRDKRFERLSFRLGQWERAVLELGWTSAFIPSARDDLASVEAELKETQAFVGLVRHVLVDGDMTNADKLGAIAKFSDALREAPTRGEGGG